MIRKVSAVAAIAVLLIICFVTLSPIGLRPETDHVSFERFGAFALLGLLSTLAFPRRFYLMAALVMCCAFGLEALQLIVPTRHGQIPDAIIKAIGGICGVSFAMLMIWARQKAIGEKRIS